MKKELQDACIRGENIVTLTSQTPKSYERQGKVV